MTEIFPGKTIFWEPEIGGDTFNLFIDYVQQERNIKDPNSIKIIKKNAIEILKRCVVKDNLHNDNNKRTNLHLGEVQSGKTLTMCSVIALAYDNDFFLSTVLTGTKNLLKTQNQDRIKDVLSAIDPNNEKFIYFSEPKEDELLNSKLKDLIREKRFRKKNKMIVLTLLKHQNGIQRISTLFSPEQLDVKSYDIRSIILDDEADQASPNTQTRKETRSIINKSIIDLRENHTKLCTFIQVTATAQPLFLIAENDPLSPDFISLSESADTYIGIKDYFQTKENRRKYIRKVELNDIPQPEDDEAFMPESLKESINYFIVATSIAETIKKPLKGPFTFLCHPDWRQSEHKRYYAWINNYIQSLRKQILDEESLAYLYENFEKHYKDAISNINDQVITYEDIKEKIGIIIDDNPVIRIINDKNPIEGELKEFWRKSNYQIIIGGNCIERGFTVEGILVTYMTRETGNNSDTIQQRARFCGYKNNNHKRLTRLWLDEANIHFFMNYIVFEDSIRKNLSKNINKYKPHKLSGFEMVLVRPFQVTRRNVHKELNIGETKDWFMPKFSQFLDEKQQAENNDIFSSILQKYSHTFVRPDNSLWRCFQSSGLTIEDLKKIIREYNTYQLEEGPKNIYLSILEAYTDDFKNSDPIITCLMTDAKEERFETLDDFLQEYPFSKDQKTLVRNHKLARKRSFSFPDDEKYYLPKTNLHRGKGLRKDKEPWAADIEVFSENRITLQISFNQYVLNSKNRNDNHPTHRKIDELYCPKSAPHMSICLKFPGFRNWRTFSS